MSSVSRREAFLEFERLYDQPCGQTLEEQERIAKENLPYFEKLVCEAEEAFRKIYDSTLLWKRRRCRQNEHTKPCPFFHRLSTAFAVHRVLRSENPTQPQVRTLFCDHLGSCIHRENFCANLHEDGKICQLPVFDSEGHFKCFVLAITNTKDPEQNQARKNYENWLKLDQQQPRHQLRPPAEEKTPPPRRAPHISAFTLPRLVPVPGPRQSYSQVAGSNPRPHSH